MSDLDDTILHANFSGWYIYQLCQEESGNAWTCTIRAIAGGVRREIAHGRATSPEDAIHNALGAAVELEAEVSCIDLRQLDDFAPRIDLRSMFVKREPINRRL